MKWTWPSGGTRAGSSDRSEPPLYDEASLEHTVSPRPGAYSLWLPIGVAKCSTHRHCVTLWRLPESIEEHFEARWEHWLDHAADWQAFFESLERMERDDLVAALGTRDLVSDGDVAAFTRLKRSAEGRAVPLPGTFSGSDQDIRLLAQGFGRSDSTKLAIP